MKYDRKMLTYRRFFPNSKQYDQFMSGSFDSRHCGMSYAFNKADLKMCRVTDVFVLSSHSINECSITCLTI